MSGYSGFNAGRQDRARDKAYEMWDNGSHAQLGLNKGRPRWVPMVDPISRDEYDMDPFTLAFCDSHFDDYHHLVTEEMLNDFAQ